MSQVTRRGPVKPTLNITPLIDVVFLLIVFFMLVSKIVTEEVPELQLPDPTNTAAIVVQDDNRLIVNVVPAQRFEGTIGPGVPEGEVLSRSGEAEYVTIGAKKWLLKDAEQLADFKEFLATSIQVRLQKRGRPLIFYRCDAAVYYGQSLLVLQQVQEAIVAGYDKAGMDFTKDPEATKIELVAYVPPKGS